MTNLSRSPRRISQYKSAQSKSPLQWFHDWPRARPVSQGDDLIGEVLRNMEEGLFRIRHKTLVPAVYRIYLNPEDYEPFRDVVPFIAGENPRRARRTPRRMEQFAPQSRFASARQNRRPRFRLRGRRIRPPRRLLGSLKSIPISTAVASQPGEIEVYSRTRRAPEIRIRRRLARQTSIFPAAQPQRIKKRSRAEKEFKPSESAPETVPIGATAVPLAHVRRTSTQRRQRPNKRASTFAYLRYTDQRGSQTFDVTKNQVVIGRGGRSYWVDLKLETLPDVSREHCRIRRDNETGRFTIEDVSQFGTAVNGKPVGRNASAELPRRATISLARRHRSAVGSGLSGSDSESDKEMTDLLIWRTIIATALLVTVVLLAVVTVIRERKR